MAEASLNIDVTLPESVQKFLSQPSCDAIKLPQPEKLKLCLPFGGQMQGIVDVTKAIPDDCSLTFSIMLQLPPLMASLGCFIKLLGLVKPLIDIIKAVSSLDPIKIAGALPDFLKAAEEVVACIAQIAIGVPMFIRDLLLLIAKLLKCIAQTILSLADLMGGLTISIQTAQAANNTELLKQLECAQANADAQANAALGSMDMIATVLAIAEPLMGLAGVSFTLPTVGSATDAEALRTTSNTMLSIGTSLEQIAQALPTC
jgi:hypothetical protein